jgi:hypothetical protein
VSGLAAIARAALALPEEHGKFVRKELAKWTRIAKEAGARVE